MNGRRLPRWSELRPLVGLSRPRMGVRARAQRAASIPDLREMARRRAPRAVFDYVDGAAGTESSLRRSRAAFASVEFDPTVLVDISDVDTSTEILGRASSMPIVCAPTGFARMMHVDGEVGVARAALTAGIPHTLSTLGTVSPEGLAASVPDARRWFQLYVTTDHGRNDDLVERARDAGCEALMLTVDTPVAGDRLRDVRNGLTVPPKLTPRTVLDMALHPAWWFDLLTSEPLEFATLKSYDGTVADLIGEMFDPSLDLTHLESVAARWGGPLIIKGVQTKADAMRLADLADAIVLSNHGGRQLDRAPVPLRVLPETVEAVGDRVEVYVDGGVLSGADVAAAVGLGARAVLVGRAPLYGLMAAGEAGARAVMDLLRADLIRTMQLTGSRTLADLAGRVRFLD